MTTTKKAKSKADQKAAAFEKTARQALQKQMGDFSDPSLKHRGAELIDINDFLIDLIKDQSLDFNLGEAITAGSITRTMDGASSLEVTVHDPEQRILDSGVFGKGDFQRFDIENSWRDSDPNKPHFPSIDVELDGLMFRLVQVQKQGPDIILTWEDQLISILKQFNKPRKANRAKVTRAQFVGMLIAESKRYPINYVSPEEDLTQPIDKVSKSDALDLKRHAHGKHGFPQVKGGQAFEHSGNITIKGVKANSNQLRDMAIVLETGKSMGATRVALKAAIAVGMEESGFDPSANDYATGVHIGIFQQDSTPGSIWKQLGGASRDPAKDAHAFFHFAIPFEKQDPNLDFAELAVKVQASGAVGLWHPFGVEADKVLDDWTGRGGITSADGSFTTARKKPYEFHRGPPDGPKGENTWECTKRLADQVNWRRFLVGNTFYFVEDRDLMLQAPIDVLHEYEDGVESIDFDIDAGKPVAECTLNCRAYRWYARPGEVIKLTGLGPGSGRWLVWEIERDLFSEATTITLRFPQAAKPEPAPEVVTVQHQGRGGSEGFGGTGDNATPNLITPDMVKGRTPKYLIDKYVLPVARRHGLKASCTMAPLTPDNVTACNASHGTTVDGNRSDHQGPPNYAWAADMSNRAGRGPGTQTPEEGAVAAVLAKMFHMDGWTGAGIINASWGGFRFQMLHNTWTGGDHWNHVHFGIRVGE